MYAIIETGGKQYKVKEGDEILIEKLPQKVGENVELNKVLAIIDKGEIKVNPKIKILGKVVDEGKQKKVIVFKFKRKTNYRRKKGHRQQFSKLLIEKIIGGEN